jgi:hypothetical protein
MVRDDTKRFTFSVIDPTTRRHPVIASMTKNQLEVFDEYSAVVRSGTGTGLTTPSSGMSVVSDMSDEEPTEANKVTLDDGLRTLIIITGIWVAFREAWSQNFSYGDPVSLPTAKSVVSPTSSRYNSPAPNENDPPIDRDDLSPMKESINGGKRCMSIPSVRRSNSVAPTDSGEAFGSLSKRSNSTGATFMDRAKRRSASGIGTRLNRRSMFTGNGEPGREIVVSRPPSRPPSRPLSLRQNSIEPENLPIPEQSKRKSKSQPLTENGKPNMKPDRVIASPQVNHHTRHAEPPQPETKDPEANAKGKRRHRLSNIFTIFHRKHGAH